MLNVGDKVQVKQTLKEDKEYGQVLFVEPMKEYKGKTDTVVEKMNRTDGATAYKLQTSGWAWSEEMLIKLE